MMRQLVSLLVLSQIMIACGDSGATHNSNPYYPIYDSRIELEKELSRGNVECPPGGCGTFEGIGVVGMVLDGNPRDEYRRGQCTGFLFGSQDVVALNSHCITDSMWSKRNSCSEILGIKFPPANGHAEEIRMCEQILFRSNLSTEESASMVEQDFAFFKIKPSARRPLPLSYVPVENNSPISVRSISPYLPRWKGDLPPLGGHAKIHRCRTRMNSELNLTYTHAWNMTGLAFEESSGSCQLVQGNSGAPALNSANEVIGFIQSLLTDLYREKLTTKELTKNGIDYVQYEIPNKMPAHFRFTQLACIQPPLENPARVDRCTYDPAPPNFKGIILSRDAVGANIKDEDMRRAQQEIESDYANVLKFEVHRSSDGLSIEAKPKCLMPFETWSANSKLNPQKGSSSDFAFARLENVRQKANFKLVLKYDQYFSRVGQSIQADWDRTTYSIVITRSSAALRSSTGLGLSSAIEFCR